jgi:hypothetical protein
VILPVAIVWWLYLADVVTSYWACLALGVALSLLASLVGNAYWKRRRRPGDVMFSEVLLWGWLRRLRAEHRTTKAVRVLGLTGAPGGVQGATSDVAETARKLEELASALDAQDPYTDGHSRRVALHAELIAHRLRLPREEAAKVQTAATLHDIGKLRIPREVLNKPSKLTPEEFELTKRHADEGAWIVACLGDPEIAAMVRHHHERFDGGGYPSGLVGDEAPLGARIIAVADTFDALTSARPYRPATSHKQALALIAELSGTQLDPTVVRAFLKCYSGKRTAVFWTLLAISPVRAVASIGERPPALGIGPPAATVASAATITTLAAIAVGSWIRVAPASYRVGSGQPVGLLQAGVQPIPSGPVAVSAASVRTRHSRHARSHGRQGRGSARPRAVAASVALAGGSSAHARATGHAAPSGGSGGGGSSGTPGGSGGGGSTGGSGGGSGGGGSGGGSKGGSGGGSTGGSGGGSGGGVTTTASGGGTSGGSAGGSGGGSGTTSTGTSGGGQGGSGSGGSGSSGAGSGGSGSGGSGSGSGSGGSGPGVPHRIEDCKNGGWVKYGFSNQGACVSSVAPNH